MTVKLANTSPTSHRGPSGMTAAQPAGNSDSIGHLPVAAIGELKFRENDGFQSVLRQRVDQFFQKTGRRRHDDPRMYLKTAIIFTWFVLSYALLVFVAATWWLALPLAV